MSTALYVLFAVAGTAALVSLVGDLYVAWRRWRCLRAHQADLAKCPVCYGLLAGEWCGGRPW